MAALQALIQSGGFVIGQVKLHSRDMALRVRIQSTILPGREMGGPTADDLRAKVFEDRETPGA
jgi:hypothetical protein